MARFSAAKAALLFAFVSLATASLTGVITNPPISATKGALKWQPVLDWDNDVCYQTSAIDSKGKLNLGLEPSTSAKNCRATSRLRNCNTYARERCNHGWCVYMYGYYSEMDRSTWAVDEHRHDWEHAMVWTRGGEPWSVMWSAHGDYSDEDPRKVRWKGHHPKLVSHRGGGGVYSRTASLRLAESSDDKIENALGVWLACPLQQIGVMNDGLARKLLSKNWGGAHMDLTDDAFPKKLEKWMPKQARKDGFTARD